jgi:hypothetical protein
MLYRAALCWFFSNHHTLWAKNHTLGKAQLPNASPDYYFSQYEREKCLHCDQMHMSAFQIDKHQANSSRTRRNQKEEFEAS